MTHWLSVDAVAFHLLGYAMSWLELVGTIAYLASVVLVARRNMWTWPIGIVAVVLYALLFWQIRLYSDAGEQAYYLVASAWGWWSWARARGHRSQPVPVGWSRPVPAACVVLCTALGSVALGAVMTHVHDWWPRFFPEPASFPWLDALTTVMSLVAMALMAARRAESWVYWIVVDVLGVGVYFAKGVVFVSLLYVVLLSLACWGLASWHRAHCTSPRSPRLA